MLCFDSLISFDSLITFDSNLLPSKMLKSCYKSISMLAEWSSKIGRKKFWSQDVKEMKTTATPNESSWTILLRRSHHQEHNMHSLRSNWLVFLPPCKANTAVNHKVIPSVQCKLRLVPSAGHLLLILLMLHVRYYLSSKRLTSKDFLLQQF